MKRADREARAKERAARTKKYELQEEAMRSFFNECRSAMLPEHWIRYYQEAQRFAGETLHIFQHLIFALAETQLPITPRLRKAIDAVLEICVIERDRWGELRKLNYDKYWKTRYGYNQTEK
jgi:hypothetical protein